MPLFLIQSDPLILAAIAGIAVFAGFIKGSVGFALPMIMISGLASFLPPDIALATLLLPALVTNVWQALRNGIAAAFASARRYRFFIGIALLFIAGSAQLVRVLPDAALFLILGVPVTLFAFAQLVGWVLEIRPEHRRRAEVILASLAGFIGGMSGIWGPQTVAYLTAINTPKVEHVRVQGVIYAAASIMLVAAHLKSGVLNAATAPMSLVMVLPAAIGMLLGFWVQDRLDQDRFRRATLVVLVLAGLNLVRRGLIG